MNRIRIAELKARLSEQLRKVRGGQTIIVMDRDTPIARLIPYESSQPAIVVHRPRVHYSTLGEIPVPPPVTLDVDVVDVLLEGRDPDR